MLTTDDIRLKFLLNLPTTIEGIGDFRSPSLKDVIDLTEHQYITSLSTLLFSKDKVATEQEQLDNFTDLQILTSVLINDISFREMFFCGLWLHLGKIPEIHESGLIFFDELSPESILTEEKFNYIKKLARIANNLDQAEEYDAANDAARKLIEKIKRNRAEAPKVKPKQPINLHSIISAVGWKAQSFDLISKLNIYQIYDGYHRLGYIDNYHYTMTGIYTGTVDANKVKLPDLNWANIMK